MLIVPKPQVSVLSRHDFVAGAELKFIEGARHSHYVDHRQEANDVVLEFLARHPLAETLQGQRAGFPAAYGEQPRSSSALVGCQPDRGT